MKRTPLPLTRIDLRAALDMLPRYDGLKTCRWHPDGKFLMTNFRKIPEQVDKALRKIMDATDRHHFEPRVEWVDVWKEDVHVIHRSLRVKSLMFLYRRRNEFNKWAKSKLPIYLRWRGKLIVWNGTHRMTLGRLTGKKIRARVFDLDFFFKWKKTHPIGWDDKVITFKPLKGRRKKR